MQKVNSILPLNFKKQNRSQTASRAYLTLHFSHKNLFLSFYGLQKSITISSGSLRFKGREKKSFEAFSYMLGKIKPLLLQSSHVYLSLKGSCSWKRALVKKILTMLQHYNLTKSQSTRLGTGNTSFRFSSQFFLFLEENFLVPFNGCRKAKPRRI